MKKLLVLISALVILIPCLIKAQGENQKRDAYLQIIISYNYFSKDSSKIVNEKIIDAVEASNINIIPNDKIEKAEKPNLSIEIKIADSLIVTARSYGYDGLNSYESDYPKRVYKYNSIENITDLIKSYIKEMIMKKRRLQMSH